MRITEQSEFTTVLPWAKAYALAQGAGQLTSPHFLQAAHLLVTDGTLTLGLDIVVLLAAAAGSAPKPAQPVAQKMPLSDDLRTAISADKGLGFTEWLRGLLHNTASGSNSATQFPDDGEEWKTLHPWLLGAMKSHGAEYASPLVIAQAVVSALAANALTVHVAFEHLCQGHADELLFWLEHSQQFRADVHPLHSDSKLIALAAGTKLPSTTGKSAEFAPSKAWLWLHVAVNEANQFSRLLQVAYHEAGHAVALHALIPETSFKTITIEPSADSSGHVAPQRNDVFSSVYDHSLEYAREQIVVFLAGRAAENKRYGRHRGDSGAASDFSSATRIAWRSITAFGLDPVVGPVNLAAASEAGAESTMIAGMSNNGWMQYLAQQRLHAWLFWGAGQAERLIEERWDSVDALAVELMQYKTLDNNQALLILSRFPLSKEFQLADIPV